MTPIEIKIMLLRRGRSIAELARQFDCRREELSMCINQLRVYPKLRVLLAAELGLSVEQLFGTQMKRRGYSALGSAASISSGIRRECRTNRPCNSGRHVRPE
jgi:hypothetical protein